MGRMCQFGDKIRQCYTYRETWKNYMQLDAIFQHR